MKAILVSLVLLAGVSAQANNVFRRNTSLPQELQARVLAYVGQLCGHGEIKINDLREESTTVVVKQIDQGVRDRYYTTKLKATWLFDGVHPSSYDITVRTGEWDISNPSVDRYEVLGLDADQGVCN